jgi:peptidoglycan-associated lipoprotein
MVELSPEEPSMRTRSTLLVAMMLVVAVGACGRNRQPPVTTTAPPPATVTPPPPAATTTPQRVDDALPVPAQPPLAEDSLANRSLDDLNRNSPLKPVFFQLDSSDLDDAGRAVVAANAEILKKNATWVVTIEGHCDERGTAEYNLALGEKRAVAARAYLLSLGIAPNRVRTVSYGKEFPFDPGHTDAAWSMNRRGHFVITSR